MTEIEIFEDIHVELIDSLGSDLRVADCARVSFGKSSKWDIDEHGNQVLNTADKRIIAYLAKEGHWSPFSHCFITFRVTAPYFVARQLQKHTVGLAWNEISRRYVDNPPTFYIPKELRMRCKNKKQGSADTPVPDNDIHIAKLREISINMRKQYEEQIKCEICPEQARLLLPQNTMTQWIWSGSLYAFARVCKLRLDPHAQYETRLVAERISEECDKLFPVSWQELLK